MLGPPPQVARLAHDKHGGAEGLLQHQQARLDRQLEGRLKVRRCCTRLRQQEGGRRRAQTWLLRPACTRLRQRGGGGGSQMYRCGMRL